MPTGVGRSPRRDEEKQTLKIPDRMSWARLGILALVFFLSPLVMNGIDEVGSVINIYVVWPTVGFGIAYWQGRRVGMSWLWVVLVVLLALVAMFTWYRQVDIPFAFGILLVITGGCVIGAIMRRRHLRRMGLAPEQGARHAAVDGF
ncbi:hypothetical protein [Corynebacterium heidelbergense]|nr:hypothetical protein [Corynebacterium heidelbergense]